MQENDEKRRIWDVQRREKYVNRRFGTRMFGSTVATVRLDSWKA